ncbi:MULTISPECIES: response regulator [Phaeodactylibacter]|jgi:CRP-like cAMP-binding protein/FixJ family two-component response regulator|uniref:response regulator n=1 Tax=Phaeodactylibacter TaxID=1564515 RepID=UPI0024A8C75F|nr:MULTISPECIES: response regulator [Phaeodactylibacter]MCI4649982.1 response regulator [Phaeodactylibacter sp.]MCI5093813.1 response regulator [Phaeodactylibacter sp.]MCR9102004.1 response regulator [bacterium]
MKKILVIEDNEEVRENLEEILELSGYQVTTAEDGKVGVEKALTNPPDLILCDVMMPHLDGFGVLNILSKKSATSNVPFIFLTAKTEKSDFRRGMNLGADDYVTKPFYKDELLDVIETRLEKSERLKKQFDKTEQGLTAFINEAKGYEELRKLSDERKVKHYKRRDLIFEEGDYPRYLYFVKSGKAKVFKTNEDGKEYIIEICKEGDFFGYLDLLKEEKYTESAAAMEETEISLIPKEDFSKLLNANRDVASQMIKMLASNVTAKEEQLLNLAYNSVRRRVADAILLLHEKQGEGNISILRDDLARIVGTAKESVIRMLTEFKEDGYIEVIDGAIKIVDPEGLRNMHA